MQAVILCGGRGARLRPYTTVFPKPLMPIGDQPILEVVIGQLRRGGFDHVVLAVGHQHELFRTFFGDGEKWGVRIEYSLEDRPLGTAGPLRGIENLDEHFLLMNGDILTDLNFAEAMEFHRAHGGPATIFTHERRVAIDYGVLQFEADGVLREYVEKPRLNYAVSMGVYCLSREVAQYIPPDAAFDFPDLIHELLERERQVICRPYDGYWQDIGRPDDYETAIEDFERMGDSLLGK